MLGKGASDEISAGLVGNTILLAEVGSKAAEASELGGKAGKEITCSDFLMSCVGSLPAASCEWYLASV